MKRNVDVEERVSTATCILERPQFLSRPQSKCQFQLRRRDCRPILARARAQARIFARVLRFSARDRVSLSGPPLEHCGDTVLAESFTRDAPNMKFATKINLLVRTREVSRGFIPRRPAHCEVWCHVYEYLHF